jgi:hypothetical protein
VFVGPVHPANVGVTVMVPLIAPEVLLLAVNAGGLPEPVAASPIAVLEFVHVKVAPAGVLVNVPAGTAAPLQTVKLAGTLAVGKGLTVTVDTADPLQPEVVPVTV